MTKNNYIGRVMDYCIVIVQRILLFIFKVFVALLLLFALSVNQARAGEIYDGGNDAYPVAYDEIPVHVVVQGYKMFYLDAIYTHNKLLYVNIEDLFRTLNIACTVNPVGNRINGFIENESKIYTIDYTIGQLKIGNNTFNRPNGLIKESGSYYIESSLVTEAFGMTLAFNYRSMTITLKSSFELPVIKQMRIDQMRSNMAKVQGNEFADTILQRNYHLFKFGTLDWMLATSQTWNKSTDNHYGIALGTELLYGEADVSINYYNQYKFDSRQLLYIWRWVDNENKFIKQAQVGKVSIPAISFINNQVIGAVIRNSPTTVRKASGYYTISEVTEPNWTVELYINDVLVNYTQADASGAYTFKVPIVYGYTTLKLKFYGPMGEERVEERTMNVPYTVMPAKEFEYSISAGVVQDSSYSRFGKGELNYGVNRMLTVGGGLEYLSSISNGPFIPYVKATIQPFSKLTLNGEYAYGVRAGGMLNYYFRKDVLLEINYTKYVEGQLATRYNANVERKVKLSFPVRYKKVNGFLKMDYTQLEYSEFKYNLANLMFSTYYKQFSTNASAQINWIDQRNPYITLDMALSYRMQKGFVIRPSARFNVNEGDFMSCKAEIEKRIPKGYLSVSYERNFSFNDHFINVSFKYDLPFARTNISASQSKNKVTTSQSAQGSLAFGGDNYTYVSNNSSVSKGGILLYPYLDLNHNGVFDKGEHMVMLNSVKTRGGKAIFSEKDSIIRINDLNAFTNYMLEFKDNDLQNIAWRFPKKIYQVLIDPNQFKRVDVPIIPVGEASGMVYLGRDKKLKGLGRITISFYDAKSNKVVAETLSESDGYIYFLGLEPGEYIARVDSVQLNNLGLRADHSELPFTIKTKEQGDIVGGLDFILRDVNNELLQSQNSDEELIIGSALNNDNIGLVKEKTEELKENTEMVPLEIEKIIQLVYTLTQPVKTKPEVMPEDKNIKIEDLGEIAYPADTVSLLLNQDSVRHEKEMKILVRDSEKIVQPSPLHRIDQPNLINKTTPEFPAEDTLFKVQLLAVKRPLNDQKYFANLIADVPGLTIEETLGEDGLYHYSTKTFTGISEAAKYQKMIKKSGWKDSFVAKYAGERRTESAFRKKLTNQGIEQDNDVPLKQLTVSDQKIKEPGINIEGPADSEKSLSKKSQEIALPYNALHHGNVILVESEKMAQFTSDTIYKVQLLAVSKPININNYFALLLSRIPGLKISENQGEDGLYRYTADTFTSIEKARNFNALIRQSGWVDSFITTYVVTGKSN